MGKNETPGGEMLSVPSETMGNELPLLVYLPDSYAQNDKQYPVVYLLHGFTNHFADGPSEEGLRNCYPPGHGMKELANEWQVILAAPACGNNYYLNSSDGTEMGYETYIAKELPAYMDANYRTTGDREGRILAGFSMGGYGALRLICLHSDVFCCGIVRAAAVTRLAERTKIRELRPAFVAAAGVPYKGNEDVYAKFDVDAVIGRLADGKTPLVIECGIDDSLVKSNRILREKILALKIPHIYGEHPGGHVWGMQPFRSLLSNLQQFRPTVETFPIGS